MCLVVMPQYMGKRWKISQCAISMISPKISNQWRATSVAPQDPNYQNHAINHHNLLVSYSTRTIRRRVRHSQGYANWRCTSTGDRIKRIWEENKGTRKCGITEYPPLKNIMSNRTTVWRPSNRTSLPIYHCNIWVYI